MQTPTGTEQKIHHPGDRTLMWIASYNLGKGLLFLIISLSLLGFLHKDVDAIVGHWLVNLGFDLENQHVAKLLARLDLVTDHQIRLVIGVTSLFSVVFITEGVGLFLRQRWAEYLTVVFTASFIPVEIYEIFRHVGPIKIVLLIVNVVIVSSLLWILKKNPRAHDHSRVATSGLSSSPLMPVAAAATPALAETKPGVAG
jgi:uncharacterized membrane protein (DUF2068 family)